MNVSQTIQAWGNSAGIRLPRAITKKAGVHIGQQLDISLHGDTIVLTPVKDTPDLSGLLSQITPDNIHTAVDTGEPTGREQW